jgi:uncharacterized protein YkwD
MSNRRPHPSRGLTVAALLLVALLPVACVEDEAPTAPRAPGSSPSPSPSPSQGPTDAEVISFVDQMNAHRVSLGLAPLAWRSDLAAVATAHSQDMTDRDFFSHTNPDGQSPGDRITEAGITFTAWGENIAWGYPTGSSVLSAWLASSGHRANIENSLFTQHGVGKVGNIWTHVFLRPRSTSAPPLASAGFAPPPLRAP